METDGIRFYLHKYFLGFHPYYIQLKNEEYFKRRRSVKNIETVDAHELLRSQDEFKDIFHRQRRYMNVRSLSMVLRSTMLVRNFGKLESTAGPEGLYDEAYTGNHVAIFECQLKTPSSMELIDNGLLDYLKIQKLSMANWRLVDVDHFMRGNSFFKSLINEVDWHKDVESKVGTKDQRTV
jgi:hypothetical protein